MHQASTLLNRLTGPHSITTIRLKEGREGEAGGREGGLSHGKNDSHCSNDVDGNPRSVSHWADANCDILLSWGSASAVSSDGAMWLVTVRPFLFVTVCSLYRNGKRLEIIDEYCFLLFAFRR